MYVNKNGTWKPVTDFFINVSGTWKRVTQAFINVSGTWKRFWNGTGLSPQFPVTISKSTDGTTYLTTLTGTNYSWSPTPSSLNYYFEWSINDGVTWTQLSTGIANNPAFGSSASYTHQITTSQFSGNVTNTYRFRVAAVSGGQSASSDATTTITGPTNITLTAGDTGASSIPINWTSSTGAGRYLVEYKLNTSSTWSTFSWVGTTYETITGLSEGTLYNVRVTPYTSFSNNSTYKGYAGNPSSPVNATTKITPGNLTNVVNYNFTGNNAQGFFTTGTNTTRVNYYFNCVSIPSLSVPSYNQNTNSGIPYKIEQNLLNYFTLRTWNYDTYSGSTTYYQGNTVWFAGNQYTAKLISFSGQTPSLSGNTTYWTRGAQVGTSPSTSITYSASTTYIQGNTVTYGSGTTGSPVYTYTANDPGFSGQTPTNTSYWNLTTTVTYNIGDYVLYNGSYYFCKSSTNGTYPTNTTFWIANSVSFQMYATPYNVDIPGNTSAASRTVIINGNQTFSDPLQISSGPTFSNITATSFRTTFLPSVYTNQVYFYIQKVVGGTYPTGYNPKVLNVSGATSTNHDTETTMSSDSDYSVTITARYVYDGTYGISHTGSSSSNTVRTALPLPDPPTNLSVTDVGTNRPYGNAAYNLSWTAPTYTGGVALTGYKIQYQVPSVSSSWFNYSSNTTDTANTSVTLTGFGSNLSTNFRVYSVNSAGQSTTAVTTASPVLGTTVPQAPTIGTASSSNTYVLVTYTGNATGGKSVTSYIATSSPGSITGSASSGAILVFGLTHNTAYSFTVTATNANGTSLSSGSSNVAYGVNIGSVTVNSSSATSNSITLNFTKAANSTSTRGYLNNSLDGPTSGSSYTFGGLVANTNYSLGLAGTATVNGVFYEGPRNTNTYSTTSAAPGTPTSLSATTNRTDGINLTFSGSSGATSYDIFWNFSSGGTPGPSATPDFTGVSSPYLDTTMSAGTTRYYWVRGRNANGTSAWYPAVTGVTGTRISGGTIPATPTNVSTSGSGLVTWTASSGATSYTIEYYLASSSSGANAYGPLSGTSTSTSFQISYQTVGGIYLNYARARVRANNASGSSSYSAFSPATGYV